ncbi:hypothetical protein COCVIDRAFT_88690, partial [Bipolaris victoriae FI3]
PAPKLNHDKFASFFNTLPADLHSHPLATPASLFSFLFSLALPHTRTRARPSSAAP